MDTIAFGTVRDACASLPAERVLVKSDLIPTCHLISVVDDHSTGIAHVIRTKNVPSMTGINSMLNTVDALALVAVAALLPGSVRISWRHIIAFRPLAAPSRSQSNRNVSNAPTPTWSQATHVRWVLGSEGSMTDTGGHMPLKCFVQVTYQTWGVDLNISAFYHAYPRTP
jgi:hypothetical protein